MDQFSSSYSAASATIKLRGWDALFHTLTWNFLLMLTHTKIDTEGMQLDLYLCHAHYLVHKSIMHTQSGSAAS